MGKGICQSHIVRLRARVRIKVRYGVTVRSKVRVSGRAGQGRAGQGRVGLGRKEGHRDGGRDKDERRIRYGLGLVLYS